MESWAVALHVTLVVLMAAAVWRLWVLGRQVKLAGEAASAARARLYAGSGSGSGSGSAVALYRVDVHASAAAAAVAVVREGEPPAQAVPLLMSAGSPGALALAGDVARGAVTHGVAGGVLFEALPGEAWEAAPGGWARPASAGGSDVLVWARPLGPEAAAAFPFPALREDSALQLGAAAAGGYAQAIVLAF